jgi:hypothetical protein
MTCTVELGYPDQVRQSQSLPASSPILSFAKRNGSRCMCMQNLYFTFYRHILAEGCFLPVCVSNGAACRIKRRWINIASLIQTDFYRGRFCKNLKQDFVTF